MQFSKEKAINRILLGLAVQYVPLIMLGTIVKDLKELPSILSLVISFSALGFFIGGYVFFIKGCRQYTQSKGYSSKWGWLGLFSVFGLSILLLIPHNKNLVSLDSFPHQNLSVQTFDKVNIPELLLSVFFAIPLLFLPIILIFSLANNLNFSELTENSSINAVLGIASYFWATVILFSIFQKKDLHLNKIINYKNKINLKLTVFVVFVNIVFAQGFNSIALYNLSFLFPDYVEYQINEKYFNNIPEIFLFIVSAIVLAPAIEELLFRGTILQKWSTKWGVRLGVLTSSLLFGVIHLNVAIFSLFILGMMLSVLYFKTRNLLSPILCHCFYNITVTIFHIYYFFSNSPAEREAFISVSNYQTSIQPLLGQQILLVALTAPLIVYFLYKNFPKNDAILPYTDIRS